MTAAPAAAPLVSADFRLALGAFSLEFALEMQQETVVIFGPSGSGKSITLRAIAGLLRPDTGRIDIQGASMFDAARGVDVAPHLRPAAWVPQDLGLFPHLSVMENVLFGMPAAPDRERRARALLALTGVEALASRRPRTISGGQAQRVALARALARETPLLLLDEPFSALDEAIRDGLRRELRRLRRDLGRGAIFVTHDLREAYLLADRLVVLVDGRVRQSGPPDEPFLRPADREVATLMGFRNVYRAEVVAHGPDSVEVDFGGRRWRAASWAGEHAPPVGAAVDVGIRAERVALRRVPASEVESPNGVSATLVEDDGYGLHHLLRFQAPGDLSVEVDLPARPYSVLGVDAQREWTLELAPEDLHVMPATRSA